MKRIIIFCISWILTVGGFAQQDTTVVNHIARYKNVAQSEKSRTGIPASITLAQSIEESKAGTSHLTKISNNYFGIKCNKAWKGKFVYHDDDKPHEKFRAYKSAMESFIDHSDLLLHNPEYAFLFKYSSSDYKSWAKGLQSAGYATNKHYAKNLIAKIEKYNLYLYDLSPEEIYANILSL